jgi:poly-gamma-glutamate synthesis protein (capsule biosynthesis protein)
VGHHPHVVQNYEKVGDKIIFYSLGNFIFDTDFQRLQNHTENGVLLKLRFTEDSYSWEHLPILIDREENRVKKGHTPDIFTHIGRGQYNLLWPLAGWDLCRNEKKKHAYTKPHMKDYSWLDWLFKWELKRMNQPQGKYLMIGRFLSIFQIWRFADKKLKKYIIAKKEK